MQKTANAAVQLLVLDPRVEGWPKLLVEAGSDTAVLVLDPTQDGLTQIIDVAHEIGDLTAIHIAGLATPGCLWLGRAVLDSETLPRRAQDLVRLGAGMAPGGMLLLRGEQIGQGAIGARFIAALGRAVGRDVVGSGAPLERHRAARPAAARPQSAAAQRLLESHPA